MCVSQGDKETSQSILLFSQVFHPDVVAVAQYLRDLAVTLAKDGNNVTAVAAARAYDNPAKRFPRTEIYEGVTIRRVPVLALGKKSKLRRIISFASFFISSAIPLLTLPKQDVVVVLSSPPLLSAMAALYVKLRGGRLVYWIMDLNPDEAIAAGWMKPGSLPARLLEALSRFSLNNSSSIVVLDRFMGERILQKGIDPARLHTIPPWTHEASVAFDSAGRARVREAMGWKGKFVVMYSGNHSPLHPLDTLLQAALQLRENPRFHFVFAGGGSELPRVRQFAETHGLTNIQTEAYCSFEELPARLSASDLQVVLLGDPFVGIVHPCKIYNMLEVERPILYLGPAESHVMDLHQAGFIGKGFLSVRHGDVTSVIALLTALSRDFPDETISLRTPHGDLDKITQAVLIQQFVELLQRV